MMSTFPSIDTETILILAKTYPNPSSKYGETTCVAGITDNGKMRRLYPIPFRLLESDSVFQKWQWVKVTTGINTRDKRPESRRLFSDTITPLTTISTKDKWRNRKIWLDKVPRITHFLPGAYVTPALNAGISLGVFTPQLPLKLEIIPSKKSQWSDEDLKKLKKSEDIHEKLHFLSEDMDQYKLKMLEIIPYDFYYRTKVNTSDGNEKEIRIKLVDWEVCAAYRKFKKDYGDQWIEKFKLKIESEMNQKDLKILMGNQHRFQHEWLGISIIYPPKQTLSETAQRSLFD